MKQEMGAKTGGANLGVNITYNMTKQKKIYGYTIWKKISTGLGHALIVYSKTEVAIFTFNGIDENPIYVYKYKIS